MRLHESSAVSNDNEQGYTKESFESFFAICSVLNKKISDAIKAYKLANSRLKHLQMIILKDLAERVENKEVSLSSYSFETAEKLKVNVNEEQSLGMASIREVRDANKNKKVWQN